MKDFIKKKKILQENAGSENYNDQEETTLKPVITLYGHITGITALAFSLNGMMLSSGCTRGWLNVWSLPVRYDIFKILYTCI